MQTNKNEIVVIGHDENALIFNTIGIKGYVCLDNNKLLDLVKELNNEGIKIFIISNNFNNEIIELREIYNDVYPIFLVLNLDGISDDSGINNLRKDVERAIGISLI